ncbi:Transposon TX1 uncharacterized 149 kDa protein [Vitis vinifera]|uniref:Transposon TX1 uncharacterized 149 kDa protein n=1 Tax=Vitis vinifera TaxID=29760 RepID=A0A438CPP7_VITVI|nr:Transposon TX1 uncharacterized 149 kDa protein [Vitis vinifera]
MRDSTQKKRRQFQRRRGPPSSLQALIDDRDIGVAASLFSYGVHRRLVKFITWKRNLGWDFNGTRNQRESSLSMSTVKALGKGLIFEGICEIPGVKNLESGFSLVKSLGPHLPNSVPLSQSPTENQVISKKKSEKGVVDSLKYVDIPVRVEEENQCALSNQMTESFTHRKSNVSSHKKDSNLLLGSQGDTEVSPSGDLLIDGLSRRKWLKCERFYALWTLRCIPGGRTEAHRESGCCDDSGNKKGECDRRFVGSVWTVRNKDWVALPASGASGGILIIWDSKNLRSEEVVIGSFSVSVKFALDGCGPLWISVVYGPNSPSLRKDFWVELFDIYGLTYPLWCVGGDFNVIRRSSEKLGVLVTSSMRDFDSFIRECELLDPPLRNASFTWSNLQESPVWELEELILREEIHWRQKARVKWVKEGDCNSKFYHKVANGRRNRKYIKELENERGLVLKNAESITEEILLYFEKLYASLQESLGLDRDKAPGPDGFTIAVFQDCWDVIKEDLVRVFAEFHRSGIINQSTNASFIVLLPKKSLTKKISDFRPISLITSLYKIIAKVLSGRLRGVLHETIHYTQGAFVQGRQIWMRFL